ncbi:N-chimaerin [Plakobranchus ocellatus]|uniref:N-chimaerin n=1 Tax=Plakobranchus ocellatus TaxID=259542 RepID=A0AAV4AHV1_9GAST|nr:N-chimaerin [Plakobranchus ocellatus]
MEKGELHGYVYAGQIAPEPAIRTKLNTNPDSLVALRDKTTKTRDNQSHEVMPRSAVAGDRKYTVRCFSTDTALDYTQGAYTKEELDAIAATSNDSVLCRRSASLQQHSTIGPGTYKKVQHEGGVGLVRGGVAGGSGGLSGSASNLVARRRPQIVRQRLKITNDNGSISPPISSPVPAAPGSPRVPLALPDGDDTQTAPTWNTYLYQLQLQAPQPICIPPKHEIPNRPPQYDPKEFHGTLSRQEADILLQEGDGCYLVRRSERAPDSFTLAIRFDGETKNFKLYYDGQHFVGEKHFDSVHDLVADGLIHFYIELRAADYIKTLPQESNYDESPYMAYNMRRRKMTTTNGIQQENLVPLFINELKCPNLNFIS